MTVERPAPEPTMVEAGSSGGAGATPGDFSAGSPSWRITAAGRFAEGGGLLAGWIDDVRQSPRIAWRLFLRGLVQQYRHSSLGIVLAFAPVSLTVLVFVLGRRSQFFASETGGVHSAFYGAFGVLLAQAFVESLGSMQRLFAGNHALLRRQNLPIEAPLLAGLIDFVFRDLMRLLVIVGLMAAFEVGPTAWSPLLPWTILGVSVAGGAIGLLTAPLAGLTGDLQVVSRVLMLVVAAVVPVFMIPPPDTVLHDVQQANPLTWLFDGARAIAYGGPGSIAAGLAMPLAAAALFLLAWLLCRIARPHVVERMIGVGA